MPPPRLTTQSADRLKAVVASADDLVDGGQDPNGALAKAAAAHALPVNHVPLAVRAFNTGRAVRQLAHETPWEKAAAHPIASVDGVVASLTAPTDAKTASDLSHYFTPPPGPDFIPCPIAPLAPPRAKAAQTVPETVKSAASPVRDSRLSATRQAAEAFDRAVAIVERLTPGQYTAVKRAACRFVPEAGPFFFATAESLYRDETGLDLPVHAGIHKLASRQAAADPLVANDHPAIGAIRELATAKAAYVVPAAQVPEGYAVHSEYGRTVFRKLAICPVLGTPIVPPITPAASVPGPRDLFDFDFPKAASVPTPPGKSPNVLSRVLKDVTVRPAQGFAKGIQDYAAKPLSAMIGNPLLDQINLTPKDPGLPHAEAQLPVDLARIDQQAAIQAMLADPRFSHADPKTLVDTYRDLSSLAPNAMGNRSIASDMIQRRLTTGPVDQFTLKNLVDMEKNLVAARRNGMGEGEE